MPRRRHGWRAAALCVLVLIVGLPLAAWCWLETKRPQ